MKSRYKAIFTTAIAVLIFIILFYSYGYNNTWRLWNIPTMSPHFADLRVITHGAQSSARGFDPLIKNPGDPWKRRLNYPRVWQGLYSLGINQTHTTYLGVAVIFSFLVGVCLILPYATNTMLFLVFAALLSPATLLGVERANVDLCVFFLASLSVVAAQRSYILSSLIIVHGFVLKLFPIFGFTVLLKAGRPQFLLHMLVILTFAGAYTFVTFSDLLLISHATPKSTALSYGMNVLWMKLGRSNATLGEYAKILSYVLVLLILVWTFFASLYGDQPSEAKTATIHLDSFRVGSAIYIGTFLLGNNWDYRLIFLILTIPQLILWAKISSASKVTIVSIFISLWYLVIAKWLNYLPYGRDVSFILDEVSHWVALSGLLYLFWWSMPTWVKEVAQKHIPLTTRST
jgi:hypothetical protein